MKLRNPCRPAIRRTRSPLFKFDAGVRLTVRLAGLGVGVCVSACQAPLVGPAAVITYHQVGACNGIGTAGAGNTQAYVVFAIDRIDNTASGINFAFDPTKLYVAAGGQDKVNPQLPAAQQTFAPMNSQIAAATIPAGAPPRLFGNSAFGMVQVGTNASDGASEADRTSYFLNYNTGSSDPPVVFQKLNLGRALWPYTNNCNAINLSTGNFLYALAPVENTSIIPASIDSTTGNLTVGASVATNGTETIAIEPSGQFLYAVNFNSVSTFTINQANGALTKLGGDVAAASDSSGAAVDPSGSFLFVVSTAEDSIRTYKIAQPGGSLTTLPTMRLPAGTTPFAVVVEPTGRFLYTLNTTQQANASVSAFAIAQMGSANPGALTAIGTTSFPASFFGESIAASQGGGFLYVASIGGPVAGFSIDPQTGVLGSLAAVGSPWSAGPSPVGLETDPYGANLYVGNGAGGGTSNSTVWVLAIAAGKGNLNQVQSFPLQQSGLNVFDGLVIDRTGRFLYELSSFNNSQGAIFGYAVNGTNGTLTNLGSAPVNGQFFAGGLSGQTVIAATGRIE